MTKTKEQNKIPVHQLEGISEIIVSKFDNEMLSGMAVEEISGPHRHDHYISFIVEKGTIDFLIDFKHYSFSKNTMVISYPGQVHQFVSSQDCSGIMLLFESSLVDENVSTILEESITDQVYLSLLDKDLKWFVELFGLLKNVLEDKRPGSFHRYLAQALITSFVYKSADTYRLHQKINTDEASSRKTEITKKFRRLLHKEFRSLKKPSDYATLMNISVSYLNDTVKSVTGFPLTYFIQQEILRESQRLLYYTTMSIKEIAFNLGYEDHKYFIRLFGKITGTSPVNFRKSNKH